MKKHKIAVALGCVVFLTCAWEAIAAGATFTRELAYPDEPWGPGKVFLLLGPRHGEVVGEVTGDSGLVAGDYTQIYMSSCSLGDPVVSVEGPIAVYTFDPDPANPPASYEPVNGDVFHLIVTGRSYSDHPPLGTLIHGKPELTSPDLDRLFCFCNARLAKGLSWRPVITPSGHLDLLVVPEPGTLVLLGTGCLGLLLLVWRGKAAAMCYKKRYQFMTFVRIVFDIVCWLRYSIECPPRCGCVRLGSHWDRTGLTKTDEGLSAG